MPLGVQLKERRLRVGRHGLASLQALYGPLAGKIRVERYEMIAPKVQLHGDVGVLSFQLRSYVKRPAGDTVVRWNSTAVYARMAGKWRSIHSHWSFTQAGATRAPTP